MLKSILVVVQCGVHTVSSVGEFFQLCVKIRWDPRKVLPDANREEGLFHGSGFALHSRVALGRSPQVKEVRKWNKKRH